MTLGRLHGYRDAAGDSDLTNKGRKLAKLVTVRETSSHTLPPGSQVCPPHPPLRC